MKRVALLLTSLTGLAACSAPAAPEPALPVGPPVAEAPVGLIEWDITVPAGGLTAGPMALAVTNAGSTVHDLRVRGARVDARTRLLRPGEEAGLTVDLTGEREVELTCTVRGHQGLGMARRLPVLPPG